MYAVAQKEDKGLDKAVEECKYRMKRYGGESLVSDLHGRLGCLFPSCPPCSCVFDSLFRAQLRPTF